MTATDGHILERSNETELSLEKLDNSSTQDQDKVPATRSYDGDLEQAAKQGEVNAENFDNGSDGNKADLKDERPRGGDQGIIADATENKNTKQLTDPRAAQVPNLDKKQDIEQGTEVEVEVSEVDQNENAEKYENDSKSSAGLDPTSPIDQSVEDQGEDLEGSEDGSEDKADGDDTHASERDRDERSTSSRASSRKRLRIRLTMSPSKDETAGEEPPDDDASVGDNESTSLKKNKSKTKVQDESEHPSNDESNDGSAYESSDESKKVVVIKKRKRGRPPKKNTTGTAKRGRGRPRRKGRDASPPPPAKETKKQRQQAKALVDLSWKNGGKNFPKRVSRFGAKYNATSIEKAGTWKANESDKYMELIWDPKKAEEKGVMDFLDKRNVPHNKREGAMVALHEVGYDVAKFDEDKVLDQITSKDGTEWSDEEREKFHSEFFRVRKDFREVARATGKSVNSCLAYYLGTYKKSDDYRLLKTIVYEERLQRLLQSEHDLDACAICGEGGSLLICDGCEGEYHMSCTRPALQAIPEGKWECDECVDRSFVEAKDSLIRNSRLYQRVDNYGKKVSNGENQSGDETSGGKTSDSKPSAEKEDSHDGASDDKASLDKDSDDRVTEDKTSDESSGVRLRPTSPVMEIATKLAQTISTAFSEGPLVGNGAAQDVSESEDQQEGVVTSDEDVSIPERKQETEELVAEEDDRSSPDSGKEGGDGRGPEGVDEYGSNGADMGEDTRSTEGLVCMEIDA